MQENEELVLRDKASTETLLDYVDYIKKEVIPFANNIINNKNAQISELKSENATLKTEMANKEKAQTDSLLTKTEIDLRAVVDEMNIALNKVRKDNFEKSNKRFDELEEKIENKLNSMSNDNILDEVKNMFETLNTKLDNSIESINEKINSNREELVDKMNNISIPEVKQPEEITTNFNDFENDINKEIDNAIENKEVAEVSAPSFDEFNAFSTPEENTEEEKTFEPPVGEVNEVNALNEPFAPVISEVEDNTNEVVDEINAEEVIPSVDEVAQTDEITPDIAAPIGEETKEEPVEESTNAFDSILNQEVNNEITEEDTLKPSDDVLSSIEEIPQAENNEEENKIEENGVEVSQEENQVDETPVNEIESSEQEIKVTGVEPIPEELQNQMIEQSGLIEKLTAKLTKVKRSFVNKVKEDALKIETKAIDFIEMTSTMIDRFTQNIAVPIQVPIQVTNVENVEEESKTR